MSNPLIPHFSVIKQPVSSAGKVAVFGIVRNEIYFLPHFLKHYRALGVEEFWFVDDRSDDGTLEFLESQPDCGVVNSSARFGDKVQGKPFSWVVKTLVPRKLLPNRWVLTLDADEFMLLPPGIDDVPALAKVLERNKLNVARALMMDFFPETLRTAASAHMDQSPFDVCPYFDPWQTLVWPDGAPNVTSITVTDGVRPRILKKLAEMDPAFGATLKDYRFANVNKTPMAFWHKDMHALSSHRVSENPSDRIQLVLAHFKFYPGHVERSAQAAAEAVHYGGAVEYRILDYANRELMDWPLKNARSRRYTGPKDIIDTGFLYSRLE